MVELDPKIVEELREIFNEYSQGNVLDVDQLGEVFKECGAPQPNFKLREIIEEFDTNKDGKLDFNELCGVFVAADTNKAWGAKLKENIKARAGIAVLETHEKSAEGTKHSVLETDIKAFSNYITLMLKGDNSVSSYMPITGENNDLFEKVSDGVIFCKLINLVSENTIDERTINMKNLNKFTKTENLNLALNSFKAIGIHIVNVGSNDIMEKTPHLVLGVVWQIIRLVLLKNINLHYTPGLACLLRPGEDIKTLMSLSPEELLMRWVNYHLEKAGSSRTISNFGSDLKDSEVHAILCDRVLNFAPIAHHSDVMRESDLTKRANIITDNHSKANISSLLTAHDIVNCNQKLNLAFIANLFNLYPNLEEPEEPIEIVEETREEKMYRNWMNSLGVKPYVNYLYNDLSDGIVLLQLIDIIRPGIVVKKKVNNHPMKPYQANLLKLENCNYAVELAKSLGVSLVSTSGDDITNMNPKLVLGLLFQLMRLYTIGILERLDGTGKRIDDTSIVEWANSKCNTKISSFKDNSITTSRPICDLIETMQSGSINYDYLNAATNFEEKLANAIYTISCARKIGAVVYALPDDVAEGRFKMIMTIYACLMARDLEASK